ncbi:metal-sensitive transcriptional regulator [Micromonospora halophytica]|uniref:DNA-binding transcriptional regulator, FrmR family n=1 Tax=Micromonospora halophytica TaxID=47864 RepID=A0A1C5HU33_9ACTN|nr:metal-sensitive transcriptional regulator [Micromonospora halophytica]SCG49520.1 DNA-binding transcriptional regulator, FrmR family [Micromonospora halophytica]
MKLRPEMTGEALTRLKRARGQLNAVIEMMENGEDCQAALTQLAAVSKAIDRAGYKIIASGMRHCRAARENGDTPEMTEEELEKLFLALA